MNCDDPWLKGWKIFTRKWLWFAAVFVAYLIVLFVAEVYKPIIGSATYVITIYTAEIIMSATILSIAAKNTDAKAILYAMGTYILLTIINGILVVVPAMGVVYYLEHAAVSGTMTFGTEAAIAIVALVGIIVYILWIWSYFVWAPYFGLFVNPWKAVTSSIAFARRYFKQAFCTLADAIAATIVVGIVTLIAELALLRMNQISLVLPLILLAQYVAMSWALSTVAEGGRLIVQEHASAQKG